MQAIRVYTTDYCPYCVAAKRLLTSMRLPFEEVSLEGKDDLRAQLSAENFGYRTVPMIFVGTQFIGGFIELKALADRGSLGALLQ